MDDIDYCASCNHYDCEPHLEPCVSCRRPYIGKPTKFKAKPKTNADRIRAMSDEELAKLLYCSDSLGWCHNLPECANMLDTADGIPEEKCMACLVAWIKRPAEE